MRAFYTILLSALVSQTALAQGEVIPPGDSRWSPWTQGTAGIIEWKRRQEEKTKP